MKNATFSKLLWSLIDRQSGFPPDHTQEAGQSIVLLKYKYREFLPFLVIHSWKPAPVTPNPCLVNALVKFPLPSSSHQNHVTFYYCVSTLLIFKELLPYSSSSAGFWSRYNQEKRSRFNSWVQVEFNHCWFDDWVHARSFKHIVSWLGLLVSFSYMYINVCVSLTTGIRRY